MGMNNIGGGGGVKGPGGPLFPSGPLPDLVPNKSGKTLGGQGDLSGRASHLQRSSSMGSPMRAKLPNKGSTPYVNPMDMYPEIPTAYPPTSTGGQPSYFEQLAGAPVPPPPGPAGETKSRDFYGGLGWQSSGGGVNIQVPFGSNHGYPPTIGGAGSMPLPHAGGGVPGGGNNNTDLTNQVLQSANHAGKDAERAQNAMQRQMQQTNILSIGQQMFTAAMESIKSMATALAKTIKSIGKSVSDLVS